MQTQKQMVSKRVPEYQQSLRLRVLSLCLLGCLLIITTPMSIRCGDIFYIGANDYSLALEEYAPVYVIVEDKVIYILDIDQFWIREIR